MRYHGYRNAGDERRRTATRFDRQRQQRADYFHHGLSRRRNPDARAGGWSNRLSEQAVRRRDPGPLPRDGAGQEPARALSRGTMSSNVFGVDQAQAAAGSLRSVALAASR